MWMLRMLTFITCDCTGFTVRSSHNNQPDCKDSLIQFCVTECLNRKLLKRFSLSELRHSDTEQHWELIIQPSNYSLFSNVRTMTLLIISFINPSKSCVTSFWKKRLAHHLCYSFSFPPPLLFLTSLSHYHFVLSLEVKHVFLANRKNWNCTNTDVYQWC